MDDFYELSDMKDSILVRPNDGDMDGHMLEDTKPRYVMGSKIYGTGYGVPSIDVSCIPVVWKKSRRPLTTEMARQSRCDYNRATEEAHLISPTKPLTCI